MRRIPVTVGRALLDRDIREAVGEACRHSVGARGRAVAELENYAEVRRQVSRIREEGVTRQRELQAQFTERWTAAGGKVHEARTAEEACRTIVGLLQSHGARRGVKSKSMVAEEIGLSRALGDAGIEAVESDLGEFIVQMAGEAPSHITAPALHRSRQSVGRLFAEKLGAPYSDDPSQLVAVARAHLRKRFSEAEFALSGANFLVAETGHLAVVENEGNAAMGMALPKLFIAVTGLEKFVGTLGGLARILEVLARNATGQRCTALVHLLKPADRPAHLVLVDNGRRRALDDPVLREMLRCIRCGACLNVCPVYQTIGGHAYDSVYPGPMGAVWSNLLENAGPSAEELPDLSTLCGECREVCPAGIDLPMLLLELRSRRRKWWGEQAVAVGWRVTMGSRPGYELARTLAQAFGRVMPGSALGSWFAGGRDGDETGDVH